MRFKLRTHDIYQRYHKWFAWHPVIVEDHFVWLQYVERVIRVRESCDYYEYRFIGND